LAVGHRRCSFQSEHIHTAEFWIADRSKYYTKTSWRAKVGPKIVQCELGIWTSLAYYFDWKRRILLILPMHLGLRQRL